MFEWMRGLIESGGYFALAGLMFLENVFPPLPSEFIMPFAGFAASEGRMNIVLAIIAGTTGSVVGSLPLYYLGAKVGQKRLEEWADKYGAWLTISKSDLQKSQKWFKAHGAPAVIIGRLIPGVRALIAIPAGVNKMPLPQFLIYTALGAGLWASVLAFLGLFLGSKFENVEKVLSPLSWVVVGAIVAAWAYRIVKSGTLKNLGKGKNKRKR
jgi:membrane protein DedA with SNARE-associated domain